MPTYFAAGVSTGDGSTLVCGGYKADRRSLTNRCSYLNTTTFENTAAPALPANVSGHQVYRLSIRRLENGYVVHDAGQYSNFWIIVSKRKRSCCLKKVLYPRQLSPFKGSPTIHSRRYACVEFR